MGVNVGQASDLCLTIVKNRIVDVHRDGNQMPTEESTILPVMAELHASTRLIRHEGASTVRSKSGQHSGRIQLHTRIMH